MEFDMPPVYLFNSNQHFASGQVPDASLNDTLPRYTRRNTLPHRPLEHTSSSIRPKAEHLFQLQDFLKLSLRSSAKSSERVPTFYEGEDIEGSIKLVAEKGDSICGLSINIRGRIVTGAGSSESFTFLDINVPLWSKTPSPSPSPPPSSSSPLPPPSKIRGSHIFPFSIALPRKVSVSPTPGETPQTYRLPQTFLERQTRASVEYDIICTVEKGRMRTDSVLTTRIAYVPMSKPPAFSSLRQLAYSSGVALPGPSVDPEGWVTSNTILLRGTTFQRQEVELYCSLSTAAPSSFTRGSVLPLSLTLSSTSPVPNPATSQVLDLLCTPSSILVVLRRRVRFFIRKGSAHNKSHVSWREEVEDVGKATFWKDRSARPRGHTRAQYEECETKSLEGEIRLAKDLAPTSSMGHFSIEYEVALMPFDAPMFVASSYSSLTGDMAFDGVNDRGMVVQPVEVTTTYGRGVRPIAYAPTRR